MKLTPLGALCVALFAALCALPAQAGEPIQYRGNVTLPDGTTSLGAIYASPTTPLPVTQGALAASGVSPVTAALTSATCTSAFTPIAGRGFNVSAWGTFVATFALERSFDAGVTKLPITAGGTQLYVWTAPASEQAEETEYGVPYYLCATAYTSGTVNVRISQ